MGVPASSSPVPPAPPSSSRPVPARSSVGDWGCSGSAAAVAGVAVLLAVAGVVVALRGDLPSGTATAGEFRYASELIEFIRRTEGGDWIIEVAAYPEYHPQQRYARRDLEHFAAKVKAGANSAITQFFFHPE